MPRPPRDYIGLHFDFRFRRLIVTHFLDGTGNTLVAIALAGTLFFSVPTEKAASQVLLYLLFTVAPFAIVSAVLGPLLDRGGAVRKAAVILAGFGRMVIAWMMATRTDSIVLFLLALAILVGQRLFSITRAALVPACLPPEQSLIEANSFLARSSAVAGIATALVGVIVQKLFGAGWVVRLAAVAYVLMGLSGFLLPSPRARRSTTPPPSEQRIDYDHTVMLRPGLRAIAALRALSGFLLFMLAFAVRRESNSVGFGTLLIGIGIGALISSVLAPWLTKRARTDVVLFSCFLGAGLATIIAARFYSRLAPALLAAAVGIAFGTSKLAFDSMAQTGLPRDIQGRRFARWETAFQLAWVSGAILPVAVTLPTRPALVIAGLATVVGSLFYLVDVTRIRRNPLTHHPPAPATP